MVESINGFRSESENSDLIQLIAADLELEELIQSLEGHSHFMYLMEYQLVQFLMLRVILHLEMPKLQ